MSLTSDMSILAVKDLSSSTESIIGSLDSAEDITSVWESWDKLKLSAYHGKKLMRKNYKPYHPKVKTFYLHELDSFEFEPVEKVTILMRTLKKLFGAVTNSNSIRGKRFNAKLSFVRVKGLQHFKDGKSIKDLIDFPNSYWEALKYLTKARENKQFKTRPVKVKRPLETVTEEQDDARDSRDKKVSNDKVS